MTGNYPYKKARLVRSEASHGWYIEFGAWDVQAQKIRRKRMYAKYSEETLNTEAAKEKWAKEAIKDINLGLEEGYHFDTSIETLRKLEKEDVEPIISKSIELYKAYCLNVLNNKYREVRNKLKSINDFFEWCEEMGYIFSYLAQVPPKIAQQYFEEFLLPKVESPKTYAYKLGHLIHLYNVGFKKGWVKGSMNPFTTVVRPRIEYGEKNIPLSEQELKMIVPYMKQNTPYLWAFTSFIYYALMRCSEIKRIQIKDIDLSRKILRIPQANSKTGRFSILPLAEPLVELLEKMNIDRFPLNYYLFSIQKRPGEEPLGNAWQTRNFKSIKEKFNLTANHSIYAFKHTAVCRWYEQDKDIVRIQRMCRHSSIEMTSRYLKSLGLDANEFKIDTLPKLDF